MTSSFTSCNLGIDNIAFSARRTLTSDEHQESHGLVPACVLNALRLLVIALTDVRLNVFEI